MKNIPLLILTILGTSLLLAQTNVDSLKSEWNNTNNPDTVRVEAANNLAWYYYDKWELNSASDYAQASVKLSANLPHIKWHYKALEILSNVYLSQSQFNHAHKGFEECLNIGKQLSNNHYVTKTYKNIGDVFYLEGNYPEAHKYYLLGLKNAEQANDPSRVSICLYAIGKIYSIEGEPKTAKEYFLKSLAIDLSMKNKNIGSNYNGLGLAYEKLGENDSAIWYFHKSLALDSANHDLLGIAATLNNIGILYDNLEDYEKALTYYHKSLEVEKEINDYIGIMGSLCNIGMVNHNLGNFQQAIDYNEQALRINEKANYNDFLLNVYYSLYESNKELGNFEESLEMLELFTILDDSIFSEEASRTLLKQETKYQYEKEEFIRVQELKEEEKLVQQETKRRNNLQYYGITLGLLSLFGLLFFASKFKLPKRVIEFATFIPILILFEFLLVVLDTYIENWTNGIPAYKLLINVGLAGLIFPIHTFFEGVFKKRLFKE